MATKLIINPVLWRSVDEDADLDAGLIGEPVIDWRDGKPYLRIMDGITVGGGVVGEGVLAYVNKPIIHSPLSGAIEIGTVPILQGSPFLGTSNDGQATHAFSIWEIAEYSDFHVTVFFSGAAYNALTVCDLAVFNTMLNAQTLYYARVKYVSSTGMVSSWSDPIHFTTGLAVPEYQIDKVIGSANATGDFYGRAVAISDRGERVMVGAYGGDSNVTDGVGGDKFGYAVDISADGNTVVIGAWGDDDNGSNSGSAYIFTRVAGSWSQTVKIKSTDLAGGDYFGFSVAINPAGNIIAIGAQREDTKGSDAGTIYIFTLTTVGWVQQLKIVAPDGEAGDYFGSGLDLSAAGILVAGAYLDDDGASNAGSVYVFDN